MYKYLLSLISIFITYIFIFFYFFISLENNFKDSFKFKETAQFYEKYFEEIEHLRFQDNFRDRKITNELIFNYIKDDKGKKTILFQGDSWMEQLNAQKTSKEILKFNLNNYSKIINAGTASYSPSLMFKQFQILENDFNIFPETLVIYIDQTDMGDELCRYRKLIKLNNTGEVEKIPGEKFPYYRGVFNLHEQISLSLIEHKAINKFFKTQLLINYKINKAIARSKKRIQIFFNKEKNLVKKCKWQIIENYKTNLDAEDRKYLINLFQSFFSYLDKKNYISSIFVVTHPHKLQLIDNKQLIDISNIVAESSYSFKKINHINFSKILKEDSMYKNFKDIWFKDSIHLKEKNYNLFLNMILERINN